MTTLMIMKGDQLEKNAYRDPHVLGQRDKIHFRILSGKQIQADSVDSEAPKYRPRLHEVPVRCEFG